MFNRIVSMPVQHSFFKIDLSELEAYIQRRYRETFGGPALEIEAQKYPGEIIITVYVPRYDEQKSDFRFTVQNELNDQGIPALVVLNKQ